MLTEDYLIRRINQVIALLLHAAGLRKDGQLAAAHTDVEIALELLLGMRALLLQQMDDSSLLQLLTVRGELDLERLALVADLFAEEGQILAEQGRAAEAAQSRLRALHFALRVAAGHPSELPVERMQAIANLLAALKDQRLPAALETLLARYDRALLAGDPQRLSDAGLDRAAIQAELARLPGSLRPNRPRG